MAAISSTKTTRLKRFRNGVVITSTIVALAAVLSAFLLKRSLWYAGYDLKNCPGCKATIDWSVEKSRNVTTSEHDDFANNGAVVLRNALPGEKVHSIADVVDHLPTTFMSSILFQLAVPDYLRYEHRLDTYSEVVRDWAVHGPFGKWAAELLDAPQVRLWNVIVIYHKGQDAPKKCRQLWHRDSVSAPFVPEVRSVTFNVYFDHIAAEGEHGDGLIFQRGSHKDLTSPPSHDDIFEPNIHVGDVLAHDSNVYHTKSGRDCWRRRAIQFRYVAAVHGPNNDEPTRFAFGPNRWPCGPVQWSFAHSPEMSPHGLKEGDKLEGPWYPLVYPAPLEKEHVKLPGEPWTPWAAFKLYRQAEKYVREGEHGTAVKEGTYALDGPVLNSEDWEFILIPDKGVEMPMHKHGAWYKTHKK